METNTVVLSIDDYNKLRDFKIDVEDGWRKDRCATVTYGWNEDFVAVRYYTNDEIVYQLEDKIKELEAEVKKLAKEKSEYSYKASECEIKCHNLIDDLSTMTIWNFRKKIQEFYRK